MNNFEITPPQPKFLATSLPITSTNFQINIKKTSCSDGH